MQVKVIKNRLVKSTQCNSQSNTTRTDDTVNKHQLMCQSCVGQLLK